ncbi:hypothetical protein D4764_04G0000950 [Takifugu flavidus]|uniref:Uncharacterized protein n=1 Tax=Takifugu flavidus TaxID=433684 RepID=A0A5C6N3R5_9TELE|nr:hypothetical protein D4764_04G0000950 [Takifugu flavidus]
MAGHRDLRWYRHKDQPDPDRPEAPHQGTEPPNPPGRAVHGTAPPAFTDGHYCVGLPLRDKDVKMANML